MSKAPALSPADLFRLHESGHVALVLRALYGETAQSRSGAMRKLARIAAEVSL